MSETITFGGLIAVPGALLLIHRAGLAHSIRCIGAVWYALAHGIVAGRAEFAKLRDESRRAE